MRRWGLMIALLLSLGVNLGVLATLAVRGAARHPVAAGAPPGGPPGGAGRGPLGEAPDRPGPARLQRVADELGLEGEARERFVEVQWRLFRSSLELARERFRLEGELRRELLAAEPDRERIEALVGSIAETFARRERGAAEAILACRELLDEEQERRYLELVARFRPRLMQQGAEAGVRPWRQGLRRQPPPTAPPPPQP